MTIIKPDLISNTFADLITCKVNYFVLVFFFFFFFFLRGVGGDASPGNLLKYTRCSLVCHAQVVSGHKINFSTAPFIVLFDSHLKSLANFT